MQVKQLFIALPSQVKQDESQFWHYDVLVFLNY